jgi:hypothetical protein
MHPIRHVSQEIKGDLQVYIHTSLSLDSITALGCSALFGRADFVPAATKIRGQSISCSS